MAAQIDATMWALYAWHGVHPGMRHARFWGLPPDPAKRGVRRLFDRTLQRRRFDAFHLTEDKVTAFFHDLRSFTPRYVHGYPSLIDEFVRIAADRSLDGRDLGVRVVFLTGEMLRETVRERVARFFDARVVNEYGCSESGLLAFECELGGCHLVPSAAFPEVLGPDHRRITDQGAGEAVVTDLFGEHLPLLRYRIGDRLEMKAASGCACGRSLPLVDVSSGRVSSFIRLQDGRLVYSAAIAYAMPGEIGRFQATQTSIDRLEVQIELNSSRSVDESIEACHRSLKEALGGKLEIEVQVVDRIQQGAGGKLRYFIPLSERDIR